MNNLNQGEFADIIKQLNTLAQIKPSDDFKFRLRLSLNPYIPPSKISLYQKIIRYIASVIALLIFGSSGLAFAAQKSQPGDLLYPVKQTTDKIKEVLSGSKTQQLEPSSEDTDSVTFETINSDDINNKKLNIQQNPENPHLTVTQAVFKNPQIIIKPDNKLQSVSPTIIPEISIASPDITITPAGIPLPTPTPIVQIQTVIIDTIHVKIGIPLDLNIGF